jgi:cytochrome c oxidase cbb3-type subunit III
MRRSLSLGFGVLLLGLVACEREERRLRELPALASTARPIRQVRLQPGRPQPARTGGRYEGNAYAISEGKRLYQWYNCSGCHFQGGGGIGPPLMDDQWIYGSDPQNIHETIVEGRPNGMPSYGGHIPEDQAWMITAYVQTLSGQLGKAASPGRSDHMAGKPSEQAKKKEEPKTQKASPPG